MQRRFSTLAAPPERPLPLWILYPLFFTGVYLAHSALLRLPYFWDEAGYYIPAALDFFRTGALIPHSTLTNAHPPLPSVLLAAWWHLGGTSIQGTRTFLCMVAAAALLGVFRLARALAGAPVAIAATALTALYPVWFAQSTLAHADLFAAVFSLWALSFILQAGPVKLRDKAAVALLFSLAALSKETAIVTPVALALWLLAGRVLEGRRPPAGRSPEAVVEEPASASSIAALLFPLLPLGAWYLYHHQMTGFTFGNPEFLRYNATANLAPLRILLSLWHRLVHLFFHMNLWVPVACTLAVLPMAARPAPPASAMRIPPRVLAEIGIVLLANALAFSVLGGALLTRYLLPMYPLVLLPCIALWQARTRAWSGLAALTAMAFLAALFVNPPYSFAPEDNLTYRDFVTLQQRAISLLARDFPQATVLTAWPATAELSYPDLGYLRTPLRTVALDNFSAGEMQKAVADPGAYDTALLFATKYVPPAASASLTRRTEPSDTRYFDFHRDLLPAEAAALLRGQIVWQASSHGEWAAILRFPRLNGAGTQAAARPCLPLCLQTGRRSPGLGIPGLGLQSETC